MPSEKEIEVDLDILSFIDISQGASPIERAAIEIKSAYLSMKSERDILKKESQLSSKNPDSTILWHECEMALESVLSERDRAIIEISRMGKELGETQSNRDKYKEIVEADTDWLNSIVANDQVLLRNYTFLKNDHCFSMLESAISAAKRALSLRDGKE
jgi:hypothetical protein